MPHQCTECEAVYEDGSKDLLNGCTDCGGQKFQHIRVTQTDSSSNSKSNSTPLQEDDAQKEARTTTVSKDELKQHTQKYYEEQQEKTKDNPVHNEDIPDNPPISIERDVKEIKEMLNTHFEGIRVVEQGKYELNLTQLFERETQVISIKEDGKYVINVPETFDSFSKDK